MTFTLQAREVGVAVGWLEGNQRALQSTIAIGDRNRRLAEQSPRHWLTR